MYGFYIASCMNITFNELRQQRVKYDVHTTNKMKHTRHFLSYIIFIFILYYWVMPYSRVVNTVTMVMHVRLVMQLQIVSFGQLFHHFP